MQEINLMLLQLLGSIATGEQASCVGKIKHDLELSAMKHADRLNASGKRGRREPYPCPWCWHWHVGRHIKPGRLRYLARRGGLGDEA